MSILNICDYKDEKENIYYKELQKCFGANADINSVVFEKDKNPAELVMQLMTERYDLIVGHGFGGVLALYIGRATNVKTILINPAYPAARYWSDDLADYEYKELIEKSTEGVICWDTECETTKNVYMILGRDDDVTDTTTSNKYLNSKNCFYVDGGHWPSGIDFSKVFKKLALGDSFEDLDEDQIAKKRREEGAYKGVIDLETGEKPYSDQYQAITIDEVDSKDGNIAIKWHSNKLNDQILYVYFENGKWHIDEKNGWANEERAAVILEKASAEFVKTVEITDHDGKHFY